MFRHVTVASDIAGISKTFAAQSTFGKSLRFCNGSTTHHIAWPARATFRVWHRKDEKKFLQEFTAKSANTRAFRSSIAPRDGSSVGADSLILRSVRHTQNLRQSQMRAFSISRGLRESQERHKATQEQKSKEQNTPGQQQQQPDPESSNQYHLLDRLPHIHRPTKEELLAAATGFWQRLGIRFKWFSIRSARPFNTDEIGAFVSWVFLGHIIWIIVGTTTFFSIAIFTLNTVFAQETLAGWVGNYLTKSSGVKVVFESAIVPKWGDGVITFRNVFVSRRPGQGRAKVSKGSSTSAAAAAAAARAQENGEQAEELEDTNYTQYDLSIDTINVTLSFTKWFNGKGLIRDVDMKGVRGVVDRTSVQPGDPNIDPRSYRHEHNTGDFEIDSFKLEDLLVTVYQPHNFRPFSVSIYSCELPRLRKQFLFYDLMSANMMSGSFDESLFTIHPRQTHNHTGLRFDDETDEAIWKKHSRIRVDGLKIDHLNRGVEGPFSWIHEGNVDIVADIMFPNDEDGSIAKVMSDFYDRMEATVTSHGYLHTTHQHDTSDHHDQPEKEKPADDRFIVMDLRVHLNDVRAAVPIFTKDLSYVNNALIRPIVAYINSKRTFIPVNCRVVKRTSEFDGSWTIFDSGLLEDLSRETYEAFSRDIVDGTARTRRLKKVGLWTIQLAAQALFIGLAGQLA
ncbi:Mitochondrial distribution and morphology protein 31 [Elsinoe australis]|uniref:Mitochondrial distribution and morphology protein 31 n=1 Tax=Elsinoe australis TaxID=40998 RepID=A0A2P8A4H3_9PEZI|nr:Mitochondrial distribution and morphology protein 31 [Elsinoe australis]